MELVEIIYKNLSDYQSYKDLYDTCRSILSEEQAVAVDYMRKLNEKIKERLQVTEDKEELVKLFGLHKALLTTLAPYDFEAYIYAMEWDRPLNKQFYYPREKTLRPVVKSLQKLADDELDLLCISMPPGAGKTTLAIFFLTWLAGREPNEPMLTGSHSNSFIRGVYDECLRMFEKTGEYRWTEIFPQLVISGTNAKDCRIDIDKRQRFETLEFTSIGTGNAGLYRASTLLYCDDLVSGLEVALSKERLDKLWETYTTDLRQRKIGDKCKELHIATRWSVHDVIGRLQREYGDSDRAEFISLSALDENEESNFDYKFGVGFTTKFYHEQREIMDDVSWRALYMNEPIEREGLLYSENELQRYFDLPVEEPDAIIAVCDTKDRGTDYCAMPIIYQYGQRFFVEDFICDNSNPDVVESRIVEKLLRHHVQFARFESNSAGGRIAQNIQERVKEKGGITKITTKFSTANKETRIIIASGYVKDNFLFKTEKAYEGNKDYKKAMEFLCSYTMTGKNKNDDIPDAVSMAVDFIDSFRQGKVEVFQRPW